MTRFPARLLVTDRMLVSFPVSVAVVSEDVPILLSPAEQSLVLPESVEQLVDTLANRPTMVGRSRMSLPVYLAMSLSE